jgi:hypothetical protein
MDASATPAFFLPGVEASEVEEVYADLAKHAHRRPPSIADRIYSITWRHNGEVWTATVGQKLHGFATKVSRSMRGKVEREIPLSNASSVLAIFPGAPYVVWHDDASRVWANPFLAGEPFQVTVFSSPILQSKFR